MSDTQQGPDWWMASDGKWYPPQSAQAAPPPPPPQAAAYPQQPQQPTAYPQQPQQPQQPVVPNKSGKGCLIAVLIALGLVALLVVGSIAAIAFLGSKAEDKLEDLSSSLENPAIDPSDPDAQEDDKVVSVGDSVELSGYTATVDEAGFRQQVGDLDDLGYLVADVTVQNRDSKSQPYSVFDWRLQTPGGELLSPTFTNLENTLQTGELVNGGSVSGAVVFEIGTETGDFWLLYKPDPIDAARGVWKVDVE